MRLPLRRPLEPTTAAAELARPLARAIERGGGELDIARTLTVVVFEPEARAQLRAHVERPAFALALAHHVGELIAEHRACPELRVRYRDGEGPAVELSTEAVPAARARLEWAGGLYIADGRRTTLAAGRGPRRRRYPGARNDIALDAPPFVSRDAFVLRWDGGGAAWRLELDEVARRSVELVRGGSALVLQVSSIALEDGDVIALIGARDERFELRFIREG